MDGAKEWKILGKSFKNKEWRTFTDYEGYRKRSNEENNIHLNAGTKHISLCIPPVRKASYCGKIQSLRGKRRGLGPSHTKRPSVGFRAARQRRYNILLFRPVCGVCTARQLVRSVVASRQKHATRGIEMILFLTPDACY